MRPRMAAVARQDEFSQSDRQVVRPGETANGVSDRGAGIAKFRLLHVWLPGHGEGAITRLRRPVWRGWQDSNLRPVTLNRRPRSGKLVVRRCALPTELHPRSGASQARWRGWERCKR